jgi:hypothetical protein
MVIASALAGADVDPAQPLARSRRCTAFAVTI